MTFYTHVVKFTGADGKDVTREHSYEVTEIVPGDEYTATVIPDHNLLLAAYGAVTDATINESWVRGKVTQASADGGGNVFEQALLIVDLDDPDPDETAKLTIPAPVIGVFQGTTGTARNVVDINDVALGNLITQLVKYEISDGEAIDPTSGVGGLLRGKRVLSSMKLRTGF